MEQIVDSIVFRRLTNADFFNINKQGGEEERGGGQSYIDFPLSEISLAFWTDFLGPPTSQVANGPSWSFTINSLGINMLMDAKIYQRAKSRCVLASQKLPEHSKSGKRIPAWQPVRAGFPEYPLTEGIRLPMIYIIKTTTGDFWAGWTNKVNAESNWDTNEYLNQLFLSEETGTIQSDGSIFIDTTNAEWPFFINSNAQNHHTRSEDELTEIEFAEDLLEDIDALPVEERERVIRIKARNTKIVRNLKNLYHGRCQISGDELTFPKKDGQLYSEAHHLIALGDGGSDDYRNIIIISPLIHRMLHYAKVSEIDLSKIENNQLTIQINDEDYTITWLPSHAQIVERSVEEENDES